VVEQFKELEYKYNADDIKLSDFQKITKSLSPIKTLDISSWDLYYLKEGSEDEFQRLRLSDKAELTRKRKVNKNNSWERVEIDLPLDKDRLSEDLVTAYVALDGYKENFRIYKSCFILWYEYINIVYYVVYNEEMKELGRYVEIEANKERVSEIGIDKSFEYVKMAEKTLGLSPNKRMKRSLFEIYKK
jgi:adenylate cyclase class IV